jgi:taurine--2-oxoglutarate transaminase
MTMADELARSAAEILAKDRRYVFHPWCVQSTLQPLPITGARGAYLLDADGRQYLDLAAELAHVNLGFQDPRVIDAIVDQSKRLCVVSPLQANAPAADLAELLAEVTPGDLGKTLFTLGGSEANEMAVQIARSYTGRHKIITRYRSYHGASYGALSLSGDPRRHYAEPGISGVVRALDCYCYRCPFGQRYPQCQLECADHVEHLINLEGPASVAAVLVEPVVGTNGVLVPPDGYWQRLRHICDRYDVLLIADEVITGFGRTGRWFGVDHWGVVPDIITIAKGLTSGYLPLGAVVMGAKVASYFDDHFFHSGFTYSAHPLACAAGLAAVKAYRDDQLVDYAATVGPSMLGELKRLQEHHPSVGDVRGIGMMACLELVKDRHTREPLVPWNAPAAAMGPMNDIRQRLLDRGVLTFNRWNMIMLFPPLCLTADELAQGCAALDEALVLADQFVTA